MNTLDLRNPKKIEREDENNRPVVKLAIAIIILGPILTFLAPTIIQTYIEESQYEISPYREN